MIEGRNWIRIRIDTDVGLLQVCTPPLLFRTQRVEDSSVARRCLGDCCSSSQDRCALWPRHRRVTCPTQSQCRNITNTWRAWSASDMVLSVVVSHNLQARGSWQGRNAGTVWPRSSPQTLHQPPGHRQARALHPYSCTLKH